MKAPEADELKSKLFPGSSVSNPIDILATGTPEHLALAIDYCENRFEGIDAIFVIFGTPGLVQLYEAYDVLHKKILECKKPIFPILPCLNTAGPEVAEFLKKGHVNFSDEVTLATALTQVMKTPQPRLARNRAVRRRCAAHTGGHRAHRRQRIHIPRARA